jgi:hypothetical protein
MTMQRHATLSDCGRYRYRLSRLWSDEPRAIFVMLNPSTADGLQDDPTIRRCIGFAERFGYGGIEVLNLFPWRATRPRDLLAARRHGEDIAQRELRDHHLAEVMLAHGDHLIAAWGAHGLATAEWPTVLQNHPTLTPRWRCLGITKAGAPRHPLYVPYSNERRDWQAP